MFDPPPPIEPPETKPASVGLGLGCTFDRFPLEFCKLDDAATKLFLNRAVIPIFNALTVLDRLGMGC